MSGRIRLRLATVMILVLCAGLYLGRNRLLGQPVAVTLAAAGELRQSVVASGRVLTPQRVSLAAQGTGRVRAIPVREGQTVARGQALVELEDDDERAALAQSTAAVAQAEARLRQLAEVGFPEAEQSLVQATAQAELARRQFERVQALHEAGVVARDQLDDARRNRDVAEGAERSARLQVAARQPAGSDVALARANLAEAQAARLQAEIRLARTVLRAPADGTLITRAVEPGDIVQAGRELMVLAADGETQLAVQVDEKNLAKLAVGQPALGSADAFADLRFVAEVVFINPGIDATRGAVLVKLRVPEPPAYLRQDMTVSVDIETARRAAAVTVPAGAVRERTSAAPWVLVVREGRAVAQPVTLGLVGGDWIEVTSGLTAGEPVIPVSARGVTPGRRVRMQPTPDPGAS